jgi:hypothetical protein
MKERKNKTKINIPPYKISPQLISLFLTISLNPNNLKLILIKNYHENENPHSFFFFNM